jgi:hypothetical protein
VRYEVLMAVFWDVEPRDDHRVTMEAVSSSETSVNIPDYTVLHTRRQPSSDVSCPQEDTTVVSSSDGQFFHAVINIRVICR